MRALVINLAQETRRLAFQRTQAERLRLVLEVLPAVSVAQLPALGTGLDWSRWQRPLRDVEKAALLSHRAAWERVVELGVPTLILEDDAWLMPLAAPLLAQAAQLSGVELLTLETRGRFKLLGPAHPDLSGLCELYLDRTGAAAYLLWPEGAQKLLARSSAVPALADAVLVETFGLRRWQADPAQAIQIDMAAHYGMTAPIPVTSAISGVTKPERGGWNFRLRRIYRQLVMGVMGLRTLFGAQRRKVLPATPETKS